MEVTTLSESQMLSVFWRTPFLTYSVVKKNGFRLVKMNNFFQKSFLNLIIFQIQLPFWSHLQNNCGFGGIISN